MFSVRKLLCAAAAATALIGPQAHAAVDVFDDFEGYVSSPYNTPAYGSSELNFDHFDQLHVQGGTVDLIGADDPWNLSTGYGSGFVDLDGSTGQAGTLRTDAYSFNAGDVVTLQFDLSGSQRDGYGTDEFFYGIESTGGVFQLNDPTVQNALQFGVPGPLTFPGGVGGSISSGYTPLAFNQPWAHYLVSFQAGSAGTVTAYVGAAGGDNVGPLVDNFHFSITGGAVPEPATWGMMIAGFGLTGAMVRRRRSAAALTA